MSEVPPQSPEPEDAPAVPQQEATVPPEPVAPAAEPAAVPAATVPPPVLAPSPQDRLRAERRATRDSWRRLRDAMALFLLLLATNVALVIYVRTTDDTNPIADVVVTGVDALIVLAFCRPMRRELAALLQPPPLRVRSLLFAIALILAVGAALEGWFYVLYHWFEEYEYLTDYRTHGWPVWSAVVLICVCPAFFEEIAFRGYLMRQFAAVLERREVLVLQAALFAIAHCSVAVLPSHFLMGLGLGLLRQRTGSLVPGMVAHALWNGWVVATEVFDSW